MSIVVNISDFTAANRRRRLKASQRGWALYRVDVAVYLESSSAWSS